MIFNSAQLTKREVYNSAIAFNLLLLSTDNIRTSTWPIHNNFPLSFLNSLLSKVKVTSQFSSWLRKSHDSATK